MNITPGHFAKVKYNCKTETVIIQQLTFHQGKLVEILCGALNKQWARGFYPNEIIEVIENPDAEKYVAELNKKPDYHRYIIGYKKPTKIIPNEYEDGYLNNFD